MTLLLLLGGASSPAAATPPATYYLTRERMLLYLVSPDRATHWRIGQWTALSVEKEDHDAGSVVISAPINAGWITSAASESVFDTVTGWERFSIDAYIDGRLEWSGPIMDRKHAPGAAAHAYPTVTFTAETFTQHLPKRRANNTSDKSQTTYTDQADDIVRQALRNANGAVTPTGYPGTVSRADFGDWTMAVEANTGSAASLAISEQDGNNAWLFCAHVAEKGDLYISSSESPAATFTYAIAYPYQRNDRSAAIVLTPAAGDVTSYGETRTMLDLVNVAAVKGSGSGASQTKGWQSDATSIGTRGVFEGEQTVAGAASTTYTDTEANAVISRQAEPTDTIEIAIRSVPGARFVYHPSSTTGQYGMRDKVSVVLPQIATAATVVVRGWRIEQSGGGPIKEFAKVGDLRPSVGKTAALYTGFPGPFSSGDRHRTNSGT